MAINIKTKTEEEKKMDAVEAIIEQSGASLEAINIDGCMVGVGCASSEEDKQLMESVITQATEICEDPYEMMMVLAEVAKKQDDLKAKAEAEKKAADDKAAEKEVLDNAIRNYLKTLMG